MTDLLEACLEHAWAGMSGDRRMTRFVAQISSSSAYFRSHPTAVRYLNDIKKATSDVYRADTVEELKDALRRGGDCNAIHPGSGQTALHRAALKNRVDLMEIIVDCDDFRNIDATNRNNDTALHVAFMKSHVEASRFLLEQCADPDEPMSCGCTLLHHAIRYDDVDMINLYLDFGVDVNARDVSGYTPLHVAVLEDKEYIIENLLQCSGCDVNATNEDGETPLSIAVCLSLDGAVTILLTAGAVPRLGDFETAVIEGSMAILDDLMAVGKKTVDIKRLIRISQSVGYDYITNSLLNEYSDM